MFTDSFCFWVFEKRLTQENCFLFCKKYGLFNGFIFLTINKFLLSYFPNFHGQRSGGQDLSISYLKQSCFSHGEGSFKKPIHKQFYSKSAVKFQAWFLYTLALIYGFLLYLKPVKVQYYRITHVHNYHSFRSMTILSKILHLILFGHIKTGFVRYLIWICLKSQLGYSSQSVKRCKILNQSVSVIGLYVISFESTGLKLLRYKYL